MSKLFSVFVTLIATCSPVPCIAAPHFGSSPFSPPDETDTSFVVDRGTGLDTGCTFRSGGPLVFQIKIGRYVGDINADGTLKDPDTLIANGVVSNTATLRMPAYDVDFSASMSPPYYPERDQVLFNGTDVGLLNGLDSTWVQNSLNIPISLLKFPARAPLGSTPTPAINTITINIDTANTAELWCTAIDWAELSFKAISPLVLIHGTNADHTSWEPDVTSFLTSRKIPFIGTIDLIANGTIDGNANLLVSRLQQAVNALGAKSIHLVAHSKGGLDSRRFLGTYYNSLYPIKVLSLYTFSTPHHGTVFSTISHTIRNIEDPQSNNPDMQEYIDNDSWIARLGAGPKEPALGEQTIEKIEKFNIDNVFPGGIRFYTLGANADLNDDETISQAEAVPVIDSIFVNEAEAGSLMYRILGNVASITVERKTNLWGLNEWNVVTPIGTASFQYNDLVVTANSAKHPMAISLVGMADRNHSTIKDGTSMSTVLSRIETDFPIK